jgi:hypothetical protein
MPAGPVNASWAEDSWLETVWENDSWAGAETGSDEGETEPFANIYALVVCLGKVSAGTYHTILVDGLGVVSGSSGTTPLNIGSKPQVILLGRTSGGVNVPVKVSALGALQFV